MIFTTLDEAKEHLRVQIDTDDLLIEAYIEAAEAHVLDFLNLTEYELLGSPGTRPAPLRVATLMIVADLYENREAQVDFEIRANPAVERLLFPYRVNLGV
ncbi:MAG TPA: head-tail connector protein [Thauera aminoaromatica]|nr:head-tail connector protein [Thauera aminoaromatica]